MILRELGNNKFKVLDFDGDELSFIAANMGFIMVDSLPYSISGFYIYDGTQYISDDAKDVVELQSQRMEEVDNKFNDLMNTGVFDSSLGFKVDNRRGQGKDDKDNISSLIILGNEPVYFKDHDNTFHQLTLAELATLKNEMIQDGLGKYQWKWSTQDSIMNATTAAEVLAVII